MPNIDNDFNNQLDHNNISYTYWATACILAGSAYLLCQYKPNMLSQNNIQELREILAKNLKNLPNLLTNDSEKEIKQDAALKITEIFKQNYDRSTKAKAATLLQNKYREYKKEQTTKSSGGLFW